MNIIGSVCEPVAKKQKTSGDDPGVAWASFSASRLPLASWELQRLMAAPFVAAPKIDPTLVSLPPFEDEVSPADAAPQTTVSTEPDFFSLSTCLPPLPDFPGVPQGDGDSLGSSGVLSMAPTGPFPAEAVSVLPGQTTSSLLGSFVSPAPQSVQPSSLIVDQDRRIAPTNFQKKEPKYEYSQLQQAMDRYFRKEITAEVAAKLIDQKAQHPICDYATSLECYYKGMENLKKSNRINLEYFYKLVEYYDREENIALRNKIFEPRSGNVLSRQSSSRRNPVVNRQEMNPSRNDTSAGIVWTSSSGTPLSLEPSEFQGRMATLPVPASRTNPAAVPVSSSAAPTGPFPAEAVSVLPEFVKLKEALDALYDGKLLKNGKKPTIGNISDFYKISIDKIKRASRCVQCICRGKEKGSGYGKKLRSRKRSFLESYAWINNDKIVGYDKNRNRFKVFKSKETTETAEDAESLVESFFVSGEGSEAPFASLPPSPVQPSPLIVDKDKRIRPTNFKKGLPGYKYEKLQEAMDRYFRGEITADAAANLINYITSFSIYSIFDYETTLALYYKGMPNLNKGNRVYEKYFDDLVEYYDREENIALRNKIFDSRQSHGKFTKK